MKAPCTHPSSASRPQKPITFSSPTSSSSLILKMVVGVVMVVVAVAAVVAVVVVAMVEVVAGVVGMGKIEERVVVQMGGIVLVEKGERVMGEKRGKVVVEKMKVEGGIGQEMEVVMVEVVVLTNSITITKNTTKIRAK